MIKKLLFITAFLYISQIISSQTSEVIIEGQILGYTGNKEVYCSLKNYFGGEGNLKIFPDSLGRFTIRKNISRTEFFNMAYTQDNIWHSCRLILEPGNHYSFVSEGQNRNDWKIHYTPDIYNVKGSSNKDITSFYKVDMGQEYFNLIDNGTSGDLYYDEWNLLESDSLLDILNRRIKKQLSYFDDLLQSGEISQSFYDIAKLNIEYTNAFRLAASIYYSWPHRYKTTDTTIYPRLLKIYPEIFKMFPVNKEIKFETHFCYDRYVDLFLLYLADSESGKYIPGSRKGKPAEIQLRACGDYLDGNAYDEYRLERTMSYMFDYGPNSLKVGQEYLKEKTDVSPTANKYIEEFLLPRAQEFEDLENSPMPSNIVLLDESDTLFSYDQLLSEIGGGPVLLDLWGSWCLPCRYQFQYVDSIKPFLKDNGIKSVYIAFEYGTTRDRWKTFLKLHKLEGYHLMSNDKFKSDLEKYIGKVSQFPTYIIIGQNGEILENRAYFPSDTDLLIKQLKEKLKM